MYADPWRKLRQIRARLYLDCWRATLACFTSSLALALLGIAAFRGAMGGLVLACIRANTIQISDISSDCSFDVPDGLAHGYNVASGSLQVVCALSLLELLRSDIDVIEDLQICEGCRRSR